MSLLWMDYEAEVRALSDAAFQQECIEHPGYYASLTDRIKNIIYRDTRYNVDFLYTSFVLGEDKIMEDYAAWLYQLLVPLFTDQTPAQTADYVVDHLATIQSCLPRIARPEQQEKLAHLMEVAKASVREAARYPVEPKITPSRYEAEINEYMDSLFRKEPRKTMFLVQKFTESGIPLSDIYVEILAESMRRIGELWHTAMITVDTEHYCTSITQTAMAQLYPLLFASERKHKKLLCACPGTELHEMGARMVADLFESDGWDSIYLGAAVPMDALLDAVETNHPDLLALSVTMPQHLMACRDAVQAVRARCPGTRIAVGGRAFESTHELWKQWPVDLYTTDARQLLAQANQLC